MRCIARLLMVLGAALGWARGAEASCDVIPPAAPTFRGTVAAANRPFARPGDWVKLTLDAACHGSSPGFSGTAADHVVSVIFTPPDGGPRNVVALATNCAGVDTGSCQARPDVQNATCLTVNGPAAPVGLERLDQRTLLFRFPDTDAQFPPAGDGLTYTGPATIAVTAVGQPLPCQLASTPCSGQMGLRACVDALFDTNGTCNASRHPAFSHFTALPQPNNYQGLCTSPVPPCTGLVDDLRATIDADGNALVPMDWRGILVERDAVPVARLLRGATTMEAFEGRGVPLRIASAAGLASYSPAGVRLPPLFDPQHDPTETAAATFFGSADAPETVLRLARHGAPEAQCADGINAGLPCTLAPDCPGSTCAPPVCAGGTRVGQACAGDADCPGDECGPGQFDFSTRLAGGAGPIVLRLGACLGGSNPLASCSSDANCPGGQCGAFSFAALDPVPLDGLNQTEAISAFVMEEAIDNPPLDLNGDGDETDSVIKLANRSTGVIEPIGGGGSQARAIVRIRQPPFSYPALAIDGDVVAFLQPEPLQGNLDADGNGNVFDTTLQVFRLGAGELTDPMQPLSAEAAPRLGGRSLAASGGRVFFRTDEAASAAQETTVASLTSLGELATPGTQSTAPTLSANGNFVAFVSDAPNLAGFGIVTTPFYVYVHDRSSGSTVLLSPDRSGNQSQGGNHAPFISADGRHVAFSSDACDLIPGDCFWHGYLATSGDLNDALDVFVRDRDTDGNGVMDEAGGSHTVRVSVASDGSEANGPSGGDRLSISPEGRYVAFPSDATNLVAGDGNDFCGVSGTDNCRDVFVHDRDADADGVFDEAGAIGTVRVNLSSAGVEANDFSSGASVSGDGRFVVFDSDADNLVSGDTNEVTDVFLRDRDTDADGIFDEPGAVATTRVSIDSNGGESNGRSYDPRISEDGAVVVFTSSASNLVAGDINGFNDVFTHERVSGATTLVTRTPDGQASWGHSGGSTISRDGRMIGFVSTAGDLVATPVGGLAKAYLHDRITGLTVLLSQNSEGQPQTDSSVPPVFVSADGRHSAFGNMSANLTAGDTNGIPDVFVRGPAPGSGDLSGDGAPDDTVLRVLDTNLAGSPVTDLCPAQQVAVEGGNAAFLRPEAAGQTPGLAACPAGSSLVGGKPVLNADGDAADLVVHLWTGGSVQNLGRAATEVALSNTVLAALVTEAGQGDTDYNGDGDEDDTVVQVHPVGAGSWFNLGTAADDLVVAGDIVAFTTPEQQQGGADLNGDTDAEDRVVQVYDAGAITLTNLARAAEDVVLGAEGLVAFRTREASQGDEPLNGDGDAADDVLQVYDPVSNTLLNSGQAVTPCRLEACDPRLPYRVLRDTVTFLTLEADQSEDLNGDGDQSDVVLQVLNVRQAVTHGTLAGASHPLAAVSAGICTGTARACAGDDVCAGGTCLVPPGGCLRSLGTACDPAAPPHSMNNPCLAPEQFCQPILGAPNQGECIAVDGPCASDTDCGAGASCNDASQTFQRLVNPLAPPDGSQVFTGSGHCLEDFGSPCAQDGHCSSGAFCRQGTCHRDHGVCAGDADCPAGAVCEEDLLSATAADTDLDEVPDAVDNCPDVANVVQDDRDGDGVGDLCDETQCGNGLREPGETCDDGNQLSGDGCPASCIEPAELIRGTAAAPSQSDDCQLEWYVENPGNPPDRFGLPDRRQECTDQDPSCDFDPAPGTCRFVVATCLNNEDPNLLACTHTGVASVSLKPAPRPRDQALRAVLEANVAAAQHALSHLLDPSDAAAGHVRGVPLDGAARNFCSAPFWVDVPLGSRSRYTAKLKATSYDASLPLAKRQLSLLRLTCRRP